jgi:hypothetical protein
MEVELNEIEKEAMRVAIPLWGTTRYAAAIDSLAFALAARFGVSTEPDGPAYRAIFCYEFELLTRGEHDFGRERTG